MPTICDAQGASSGLHQRHPRLTPTADAARWGCSRPSVPVVPALCGVPAAGTAKSQKCYCKGRHVDSKKALLNGFQKGQKMKARSCVAQVLVHAGDFTQYGREDQAHDFNKCSRLGSASGPRTVDCFQFIQLNFVRSCSYCNTPSRKNHRNIRLSIIRRPQTTDTTPRASGSAAPFSARKGRGREEL